MRSLKIAQWFILNNAKRLQINFSKITFSVQLSTILGFFPYVDPNSCFVSLLYSSAMQKQDRKY